MATWTISIALVCLQASALDTYQGSSAPTGNVHDSSGQNLTDQEKVLSETYVHQGLSNEAVTAGCSGTGMGADAEGNVSEQAGGVTVAKVNMKDACAGKETHVLGNWVPLILKAYGMVVGMMPGEYSADKAGSSESGKSSEAGGNRQGQDNKEKEKKQDYCKYIVTATEMLATAQQTSAQQNLANVPGNNDNAQTEQLWKAKRAHEERAKTAEIQAIGWGAGSVCYIGTIALSAGAATDTMMIVKAGLTTLGTIYWGFEVKHQLFAAAKIQEIIDSMPKAGDCNPVTERHCFCSQESSKLDLGNYVKYCQPQIKAEQLAAGTRMACINKQGQPDPECLCNQNNSCFDVEFMNMIGGLKFGKSAEEVLGKDTRDLSRGKLANGNLGAGIMAQNAAARAKANLKQIPMDKVPKVSGFNEGQQQLINELANQGIPRPLAGAMVGVKVPGSEKYADKIKGFEVDSSSLLANSNYNSGQAKILTYTGGGGSFNKAAAKNDAFDFNKLLKKKEGDGANQEQILKFAERAAENAQISKNPDTKIFDIISNRYRLSGWKRVNFE